MGLEILRKTFANFEESFLDSLLGQMKDGLLEWNIKDRITKNTKTDIILSIFGLSLFEQPDFRRAFFLSCPDQLLLQQMCVLDGKQLLANPFDQEDIANYFRDNDFSDKPSYSYFVRNYLGLADYVFKTKEKEKPVYLCSKPDKALFELYDYQFLIKQQVINHLMNDNKPLYKILIHMPTGTGKTKTTMHIISHYLNNKTKGKGCVVWIAHSNELLNQAYDTFIKTWNHLGRFDINVYKGWVDFPESISDGILFTSIQALQKKLKKPIFDEICGKASLVIFDEVHKAGAKKYKQCVDRLMERNNEFGKRFLGLTATPGRTTDQTRDNFLFRDEFDQIVGIDVDRINSITLTANEVLNYQGSKEPIKYFQENGYLSVLEREKLDFTMDDEIVESLKKEMRNSKEDFPESIIKTIGLNRARNVAIVEKIKSLNEQKIPTIVFACSVTHAQLLSAFLKIINIENSLVYGDMDPFDRKKAIDDFKNNRVGVIINYDILTTGFDSTNIRCVFITRPTKSVILYSQMIGRGLRGVKMGGNQSCKLIDVEDNLSKFINENDAFKHFNLYWE